MSSKKKTNGYLVDADVLKEAVHLVRGLVDEAVITFTKNKATMRVIDPSHIAMLALEFPCRQLKTRGAPIVVGFDFKKFNKYLKTLKPKTVTFSVNEPNDLVVIETSEPLATKMYMDNVFTSLSDTKMPRLEHKRSIIIPHPEQLIVAMKLLGLKSVQAVMTVDKNGRLLLSTDGFGTLQRDIIEIDLGLEPEAGEALRSLYPLDYLSNMFKTFKKTDIVSIGMGDDYPMGVSVQRKSGVKAEILIAPRIEHD